MGVAPETDLEATVFMNAVNPTDFEVHVLGLDGHHDEYISRLVTMDLAVDLSPPSLVAYYSEPQATIEAISCGIPVIHPRWSPLQPTIHHYQAGWAVDVDDAGDVEQVLRRIVDRPDERCGRAAGARSLWANVYQPGTASAELVERLTSLTHELNRHTNPPASTRRIAGHKSAHPTAESHSPTGRPAGRPKVAQRSCVI